MSGIVHELPPEAVGPAAGVFIYSSVCLLLSVGLLWATVAHREWKSYVAMLAFFTGLATLASMAQQLHTYLRWTSIKLQQYDYIRANIGNPELSIAGPSVGIDIVFFYIQFYSYNVEAILVVSWATQLAFSIYQLQPTHSAGRYGSYTAKVTAVCLPMLQAGLMRTKALQNSLVGFYVVANILMGVSLALGVVLLLAILAKYVITRTEVSWHVQYADRSTSFRTDIEPNWQNEDSLTTFSSASGLPLHRRSIYDNWLVVRFTLAFAGLAAYQMLVIASEINFALNNNETASETTVNLRPDKAIKDICSFIPGVSPCLLAFIVFGTTKAFRDYFYRNLVPRCIRLRIRAREKKSPSLDLQLPERGISQAALRSPATIRMAELSPGFPRSPGPRPVECFELDGGGEYGTGTRRSLYELPVPTPAYQTSLELSHKGDGEDIRPGPNLKPLD